MLPVRFTDAFVRDEVIYFVPFNADGVGALHLESHRFELLQPGNFAAQSFKFWGAIQVGIVLFIYVLFFFFFSLSLSLSLSLSRPSLLGSLPPPSLSLSLFWC